MTNEDQIVALFAKANPVPSLDLLDPVEPLDMERLTHLSERSSVMTDVQTIEPKKEERHRWPRIAVGLAMFVTAVVLGILVDRESGVASPESVATAFMDAIAAHDGNAAAAVFAPDGLHDGEEPSTIPPWFEWDRAIGQVYANQGCEETSTDPDGTLVDCTALAKNDWTLALGLEPSPGGYRILVDEGQIRAADSYLDDAGDVIFEA